MRDMSAMRCALGLVLLFGACKGGTSDGSQPGVNGSGGTGGAGFGAETVQTFELDPVRDLDILFVVSNSRGMAAKQKELARALPTLFEELGKGNHGLPDLHIGVVSSDLGAGQSGGQGACARPGGDRGIFQPGKCGLQATDFFLSSLKGGAMNNFQGALTDVVGCMVQLGENGCQFPHPLQAGRLALYESITRENAGFLRPDAFLLMVFLADRDDCSGETTSSFFGDSQESGIDPNLRCSRAGHVCDGKQPPLAEFSAPLANCQAADRGQLIRVKEIVDSIKALKRRPEQQIMVATLAGWPADPGTTYRYGLGSDGKLTEVSLCETVNGSARAGLRLKAHSDSFENNRVFDVCNTDFTAPARELGQSLHGQLYTHCGQRPPAPGAPPRCQAVLLQPSGSAPSGFQELAIPGCSDGGPRPCLRLAEDPGCKSSGFRFSIDDGGTPPPPGTQARVRCAVAVEAPERPDAGPSICDGGLCNPRKGFGGTCELEERPGPGQAAGPNQAVYRTGAPECETGLCLRPARDVAVASFVDTQATCTKTCSTDSDCAGAAVRDRANGTDKRCTNGYSCAVPFEVGPLCCRKLCVCNDFLPASGVIAPASCAAPAGTSVCESHP
jgi:hypothetical protein